MRYLAPEHFAASMGTGVRAAQIAFRKAAEGEPWKGIDLPVRAVPGNRGGAGSKVWALALDRCSEQLKARLGAIEDAVAPRSRGVERGCSVLAMGSARGPIVDHRADPGHAQEDAREGGDVSGCCGRNAPYPGRAGTDFRDHSAGLGAQL